VQRNPDRLRVMLQNKPGDAFGIGPAERDAKRLAAGGRRSAVGCRP